jgi:dipeptidyl aminopeptidase/acylaminoacyl peptidase
MNAIKATTSTMRTRLIVTLLFLAAARPVSAQSRTHDVAPEDYFSLATITELAVSPDGAHVAYCEARWDKADDGRKTDLWVVAVDGRGRPRRLTFDRANDRNPKWSADGKTIYLLGNRKREAEKKAPFDGTTQIWSVASDGGEPRPVTRVPGGISGYDYAARADALFYSKDAQTDDEDEFSKLRAKFNKVEYGQGTRKVSEVHRLDAATHREDKLIDEKRYIREFAVTRDGAKIAMISAFDDSVVKSEGESRVDVWQAGKVATPPTDVYRTKAPSPYAWLEALAWGPAGDKLAFNVIFDAYPMRIVLIDWTDGGPTLSTDDGKVNLRGYGTPLQWSDGKKQTLHYLGEAEGSVLLHSGGMSFGAGRVVYNYAVDPSGRNSPTVILGGPTGLPDLYVVEGDDRCRRLTDVNPQAAAWKLPSVRHVRWKAPDGAEVGGVLELPHGYKKGEKLPLVVGIHGGPTTSTKASLEFDPHNGRLYFAAKGYAVLFPNYRGSTGYGAKFVTDLIGKENDVEVKDILAGIEHLIKEGLADPERVGVMGWSNGGYLTNCLITLKESPVKFKAASSGAGIVDTVAEWGFNDEPAYAIVFKKGLPWQQPELYKKTSPTYGLANVTTPTLIHVGGGDERCPPGHSRMLYRALKEYGTAPTQLLVYPGEPHGLTKMSNRRTKMEWDLAWFEKYLKGR